MVLCVKKGSPRIIGIQSPGAIRAVTVFEVQMASKEVRESFMYSRSSDQEFCPFVHYAKRHLQFQVFRVGVFLDQVFLQVQGELKPHVPHYQLAHEFLLENHLLDHGFDMTRQGVSISEVHSHQALTDQHSHQSQNLHC